MQWNAEISFGLSREGADHSRQGARKYPTLEAAVLAGRWPTLAESRGKVLFLLYNKPSAPAYLKGHPLLQARTLYKL